MRPLRLEPVALRSRVKRSTTEPLPSRSVEDILSKEGINCSIVDLRVLSGNIEEISREGSFELVDALLKYIHCSAPNIFIKLQAMHAHPEQIEYKHFEYFTEEKTAHGGHWQHI